MIEILLYLLFVGVVSLAAYWIVILPSYIKFKQSNYGKSSDITFFETLQDKGNMGEFMTYKILESLPGNNKIYSNVYIPKGNGDYTETDLIMLSSTGIYVFESKNYSGWIYGKETDKTWTQVFNKNSKFKFFNPIWQNDGHITALAKFIDLDKEKNFKSYIIFSERCTLKDVSFNSEKIKLIQRYDLLETIESDIKNSPQIFNDEEIRRLHNLIEPITRVDKKTKEVHVQRLQDNKDKYDKIAHDKKIRASQAKRTRQLRGIPEDIEDGEPVKKICPNCGSELVLRTARNGKNKGNEFYGCSNYPDCKHIKKII